MKWIKRFVALILFGVIFILAGAVFITWRYEDDLKSFALETVQEAIVTDVELNDNVVLSLWKDFPLVAVELSDIKIQDAFRSDTLLSVEKAFVQFDVIKLIQNNIQIEGIRVTDGFLKLRRTDDGLWNFRVWKEPNRNAEERKTDLSIEILTLENIHLDYDDRAIDLNIQFLSEKSKLKGRFTEGNTRLGLSLNGFMEKLVTIGNDRIVELPMQLKGILNIDSDDRIYTIETGNAVLAGNEVVLNAEWKQVENATDMHLQLHAGNIEPSSLLPHVWPQMPANIRNLNLQGRSDIILTMSGPFTLNSGPKIDATVRMRDGSINFQNTLVSDLNFEGTLFMEDIKRSKALEINFSEFSLKTPSGSVTGSGKLTDLQNPFLKLKSKGNSMLEELVTVAALSEHVQATGGISWNIDFEGPLGKEFNTTVEELKKMRWSGNVSLADAELKFNSGIPEIRSLDANISMNMGNTVITECSGKIGHLQFDGNMNVQQLKQILTDDKAAIDMSGDIHIQMLDITKLPREWQFESETNSTSRSRQLSIDVQTRVDEILYNDFTATDVQGNIRLSNDRVDVDNLKFNSLGGTVNAALSYFPIKHGYMLDLDGELQDIDMSRTLREWNNFGQDGIRSENLKGNASATLEADIKLNDKYEIEKDALRVESQVEISGGELIDFEPLLAMSKFIDVDELKRVQFDTLRNQLSIRNGKLHIPNMSISSSILNVNVFGEHAFDQEMDYHVNLLLNDLIRRKAKKRRTFEGHEIIDEKGKTRLFLWIRGKPGDIKFGYDKKEVRQKIKADLKQEGQTIKQLFRDEFGGRENEEQSEEGSIQFRLDDDGLENEPSSTPTSNEQPNNNKDTKPKKKKRGLFSSEPDETETEGGFEIEFEP